MPALDFGSHGHESSLDVGGILSRGLDERNRDREAGSKVLGGVVLNNSLVGHIALVPNKELVHALTSVPINLLQPLLDVVEGDLVGDIIDNDDTVGSSVVAGGDGTEPLLTGCVPNLELDHFAIELDGTNLEINTNGGDVGLSVSVIGKTEEKARLSNTRVTNQQEFEKVVVFGVHRFCESMWKGEEEEEERKA